ncbi:MAG TPA: hypothetical protein VEC35_17525 [Noviherbaspirillum sp.]|nr:hypothetical protein [Noviherbaspirillum sp.]
MLVFLFIDISVMRMAAMETAKLVSGFAAFNHQPSVRENAASVSGSGAVGLMP